MEEVSEKKMTLDEAHECDRMEPSLLCPQQRGRGAIQRARLSLCWHEIQMCVYHS